MSTWGRRLRVTLTLGGGATLDLVRWTSEEEGLAVAVRLLKHLKAEPHETEIRVYNLPPDLLATLVATSVQARQQSFATQTATRLGRMQVWAGSTAETLVSDDVLLRILPEPRQPDTADRATVITAQDARLMWSTLYADTLDVADAADRTKLAVPLPLVPNSYPSSHLVKDMETLTMALGARPAVYGDTVEWLPLDSTLALPPVLLDADAIAPVADLDPDGRREILCQFQPGFVRPGQRALFAGQEYIIEASETNLSTVDAQAWTVNLSVRTMESLL